MSELDHLIQTAEALLAKLAELLPDGAADPDWNTHAFQWREKNGCGCFRPITISSALSLDDIRCVDRQKSEIDRNTRQFLNGFASNNVLLWGSRGTGKSSLVKALLNQYADEGLRLVEIDKQHLIELSEIAVPLSKRAEKFILFCDDLSFDVNDSSYKALKAALDGSISSLPGNVLIYATSNRRHLLPEFNNENQQVQHVGGEIHHSETIEEKISLSDRFGLWLSFHPFTQDEYLSVVRYWLEKLGVESNRDWETIKTIALRWALNRGSRSGRIAWQFARDYSGRKQLEAQRNDSAHP